MITLPARQAIATCTSSAITELNVDSGGSGTPPLDFLLNPCHTTFVELRNAMFDELWQEIQDSPGEIFDYDIPEIDDNSEFNLNDYLNGDYDY